MLINHDAPSTRRALFQAALQQGRRCVHAPVLPLQDYRLGAQQKENVLYLQPPRRRFCFSGTLRGGLCLSALPGRGTATYFNY